MPTKRNLKRITLQSGCKDRLMRNIEGIFEVLVDLDDVNDLMIGAAVNKSHVSSRGPVIVRYQKATKAQADELIAVAEKGDETSA